LHRIHLKINPNCYRIVIPQLRMVNPYGKYVTQGFSPAGLESPLGRKPDSSLRARLRPGRAHAPEGGLHGPAAALKG
jgi:hypothetical protein